MAIRFFTWTTKHKRKKRSTKPHGHGTIYYGAPTDYCRMYNKKDRCKSNLLMRLFRKDIIDYDNLNKLLPMQHRHSANWYYW